MNYKALGFKSGIEVHAQLNTGKLFCRCPSILRQDEPHFIVKRELRPLAGETGEVDVAAAFEKAKKLHYYYEGYKDTTCLVELDEEPPREVDAEALKTAFIVAKLMHCKLPDATQIMRKTVVDGSNTSGFQRTMLIGYDGWIKVEDKKIGINYLMLEEDAARRTAEESGKSVTYRLDRLGIPLLEIVTAPDMKTPEEVANVAEHIGMLVKSTRRAMGGIGSIRQDINVSITGHCRVEMKGVQDLRLMEKYIDKEIERQQSSMNETPHVRNVKEDFTSKFLRPLPGQARMYPETDLPLININHKEVDQLRLPELLTEKLVKYEKLLGKELANQLIHSDYFAAFDEFTKKFKLDPKHIASLLLSVGSEVKRKLGLESFEPELKDIEYLFGLQDAGKLSLKASVDVFVEVANGKSMQEATKQFVKLSKEELRSEIAKLKKDFKNVPADKLKGIIIGKLRSRADVEDITKLF